ncbi:MAG: hypothetical protein HY741_28755 [Chloroflexi bacterium]|nr:hypothetical protein [Chloroflexota bacterium]
MFASPRSTFRLFNWLLLLGLLLLPSGAFAFHTPQGGTDIRLALAAKTRRPTKTPTATPTETAVRAKTRRPTKTPTSLETYTREPSDSETPKAEKTKHPTKTPTAAVSPVQESVTAVTSGLGIERYWAFQKFQLTERLTLYINLWNGNLVTQYQEFDLPGTGPSLSLDHTYNNQANLGNNIVGYDWIHAQRMYILDNGDNTATLYDADGTQHPFTAGATGTYTSPKGNFDTLTRVTGVSFTLTHPDSSQHLFQQNANSNWYLTKIKDRAGNAISFAYPSANSNKASSRREADGR